MEAEEVDPEDDDTERLSPLDGERLMAIVGILLAIGVLIGPWSLALWIGVRNRPMTWLLSHGAGLLLVSLLTWYGITDRRRNHLSEAQLRRTMRERVWVPSLVSAALVAVLPWSPKLTVAANVIALVVVAVIVHVLLSESVQPVQPVRSDGARDAVGWALASRRRRKALAAAAVVGCASMTTVGVVAVAAFTDDGAVEHGISSEGVDPTTTSAPAPSTEPEPCAAIDASRFGITPAVSAQMDKSIRREGREAGCADKYRLTTRNGIDVIDTDADWVVMGWEGPAVPAGIDTAPWATVWWADAFEVEGLAERLDEGLPADRLDCSNGATVAIVDAGNVIAAAGSDDYERWFSIPPALIPAYAAMAADVGLLPVPIAAASSTSGQLAQMTDLGLITSDAVATSVDWDWYRTLCN